MSSYVWDKPVIIIFRARAPKPETEPFAVVKAKRLIIRPSEESGIFEGEISGFFSLMGDVGVIMSQRDSSDRYILCWMDDSEDDFKKSWRRVAGVTFPKGLSFNIDGDKRTYEATFKAEGAKLK